MTKVQKRALEKLTASDWKSAYDVQESVKTLTCLYHQGLAEIKHERGYLFMPRNAIKFRRNINV